MKAALVIAVLVVAGLVVYLLFAAPKKDRLSELLDQAYANWQKAAGGVAKVIAPVGKPVAGAVASGVSYVQDAPIIGSFL